MTDTVIVEYVRAMNSTYDNDKLFELSIGLKQYKEMYQLREEENDE